MTDEKIAKLGLMKKCLLPAYGNILGALEAYATLMERRTASRDTKRGYLKRMIGSVKRLCEYYENLPFESIEKLLVESECREKDEASFKTIFLVREILPRLRGAVALYVREVRERNYQVQRGLVESPMFSILEELDRADKYQGKRFVERVRELENSLEVEDDTTK